MKFIAAIFLLSAWAAKWDSVAVFYRPDKVLVQINEAGGSNSRLQSFMNALKVQNQIFLESADQSFRMDCARNESAVNCALRMIPSENVKVEGRSAGAKFPLGELGLDPTLKFEQIDFLNSNGDHLSLKLADGVFDLNAGKK